MTIKKNHVPTMKLRRLMLGLKQSEIAEAAGVSHSALSTVERQKASYPRAEAKILAALDRLERE